jgi:hypothetical protein
VYAAGKTRHAARMLVPASIEMHNVIRTLESFSRTFRVLQEVPIK